MLNYNEIKEGACIVVAGDPYLVLTTHIFRKQQRKPVNTAKLKNLITGKVIEYTFHQNEKVAEAEVVERESVYLYSHRDEYWFADPQDQSKRFKLPAEVVREKIRWIKPGTAVKILAFNEKIIGLEIPIKVALQVKEAAPAVRGDTISGGNKKIILETGAEITAPLFIRAGDTVIINTKTGDYAGRGGEFKE